MKVIRLGRGGLLWVTLLMLMIMSVGLAAGAGRQTMRNLPPAEPSFDDLIQGNARKLLSEGRRTFRFDTFGDEAFWGDTLKLHRAIAGEKLGGVGPGLSPKKALEVGLKVDAAALPPQLVKDLKKGRVNLNDPATTLALLKLNAVVGVTGFFDTQGRLCSVGIQCAFCHSTVDDSLSFGIGRRLDGWANRDLNVGAITGMAPNVKVIADRLGISVAALQKVLMSWGPGKFDAEVLEDGKGFAPDGKSGATLIPPAFGLPGINLHTWGGWGSVTHWNAYVANTQMRGKGTFYDPRLNDPAKYPIAVKTGDWNIRNQPDLITAKLPGLHVYQYAIPAPKPPRNSYDQAAAQRGGKLFNGTAGCSTCHVPPLFSEPGWNMHKPEEIGIGSFQANRYPDVAYRTPPLKGLWTHQKGGFFHDGRFKTLREVVDHFDRFFKLGLSRQEKTDLVEYMKSI